MKKLTRNWWMPRMLVSTVAFGYELFSDLMAPIWIFTLLSMWALSYYCCLNSNLRGICTFEHTYKVGVGLKGAMMLAIDMGLELFEIMGGKHFMRRAFDRLFWVKIFIILLSELIGSLLVSLLNNIHLCVYKWFIVFLLFLFALDELLHLGCYFVSNFAYFHFYLIFLLV